MAARMRRPEDGAGDGGGRPKTLPILASSGRNAGPILEQRARAANLGAAASGRRWAGTNRPEWTARGPSARRAPPDAYVFFDNDAKARAPEDA